MIGGVKWKKLGIYYNTQNTIIIISQDYIIMLNTFKISGVVMANDGVSPGLGLPIRKGILIM